jgi:hypothetical protein
MDLIDQSSQTGGPSNKGKVYNDVPSAPLSDEKKINVLLSSSVNSREVTMRFALVYKLYRDRKRLHLASGLSTLNFRERFLFSTKQANHGSEFTPEVTGV